MTASPTTRTDGLRRYPAGPRSAPISGIGPPQVVIQGDVNLPTPPGDATTLAQPLFLSPLLSRPHTARHHPHHRSPPPAFPPLSYIYHHQTNVETPVPHG
jgi:hypothetical protein